MSVLMPKATAVWLVEHSSLSFKQIADFCGLHPLEVKGIADGEVAKDIRGVDPIAGGTVSREEIAKGEANPDHKLKAIEPDPLPFQLKKQKHSVRYTPVARRNDRPDAIAWILRFHPEIPDPQIAKLLGTTKSTIEAVRSKTHWNSGAIRPVDPVTLGLCTQIDLDATVARAADQKARLQAKLARLQEGPGLKPLGAGEHREEG